MRVLIIESDASFASTLRQALEARGVEVVITDDGEQGLKLAHAAPTSAVVLSVELGERLTGGFPICNRFKRDAKLRSIPLLLTSSLATEETFEQHRKLRTRADGYLMKPYGPRDLLDWLEPHLPQPPKPEDDPETIDLAGELLAGLEELEPSGAQLEPVEAGPAEAEPAEAEPVEAEPVEAEPVETEPVETEPIEPAPIEPAPVEAEPVEAEPVETEPVEAEPVETEPVEAGGTALEEVETKELSPEGPLDAASGAHFDGVLDDVDILDTDELIADLFDEVEGEPAGPEPATVADLDAVRAASAQVDAGADPWEQAIEAESAIEMAATPGAGLAHAAPSPSPADPPWVHHATPGPLVDGDMEEEPAGAGAAGRALQARLERLEDENLRLRTELAAALGASTARETREQEAVEALATTRAENRSLDERATLLERELEAALARATAAEARLEALQEGGTEVRAALAKLSSLLEEDPREP